MTFRTSNSIITDSTILSGSASSLAISVSGESPTHIIKSINPSGGVNDGYRSYVSVGNGRIAYGIESYNTSGGVCLYDLDGNFLKLITDPGVSAGDGGFGESICIGSNRFVISSPFKPAGGWVGLYDIEGNFVKTIEAPSLTSIDSFGDHIRIGDNRIVISDPGAAPSGIAGAGLVFVYDLDGNFKFKLQSLDVSAGASFGFYVDVGCGRIVVGSPYLDTELGNSVGAAYIYDIYGNFIAKTTSTSATSGNTYGRAVAVGCGRIVIGEPYIDLHGETEVGLVHIYDLDGNLLKILIEDDGGDQYYFGDEVAIKDGIIAATSYNAASGVGHVNLYDLDGNMVTRVTDPASAVGDSFGYSIAIGDKRLVGVSVYDTENGITGIGSITLFKFEHHVRDLYAMFNELNY